MDTYLTTVKKYFKNKASEYDLVDKQPYWVLSDTLLSNLILAYCNKLPNNFRFLDAGGGTGRWSIKIAKAFPKSNGTIIDISEDMLAEASKNIKKADLQNRLNIVCGDIHKVDKFVNHSKFDLIFNFHNVLGFVESPEKVINVLSQQLKNKGLLISLVPNLYHVIYFNLSLGKVDDAEQLEKLRKGKFVDDMPSIHFFTPQQIEKLYKNAGLKIVKLTGFPNTIYPGFQETQIKGSTESIMELLTKEKVFTKILKLETKLIEQPDISARGNNIFIVGEK